MSHINVEQLSRWTVIRLIRFQHVNQQSREKKKEKKKRELKRKCEGKKGENEDRFFGSSFLIPCLFPEEYLTHISVSVSVSRLYI